MKKQKLIIIIDAWHRNLLNRILFWMSDQSLLFKRIRKFVEYNLSDIHTIVVASYDNIPTDDYILNLPGNIIQTIDIKVLFKILEENKEINQIYFCGSAWDICVKNRELGYLNLYKLLKNTNIDFFIKDDCVIYSEIYGAKIFDPLDNLDWTPTLQEGIYKFNGKQ